MLALSPFNIQKASTHARRTCTDFMYTSGMRSVQLHSNWAEIDLAAIDHNVRFFCAHTDARVMAVVKANAYGHGAVPVAQTALKAGALWCGVAQAEEALELRRAFHLAVQVVGDRLCRNDAFHALNNKIRGLVPTQVPKHHFTR